jgi:hypothetical protein
MELAIDYFFFNFLIDTLLFSGWLSCRGRTSFFGGRPQEMKEMEEQMEEEGGILEKYLLYRKREIPPSHVLI